MRILRIGRRTVEELVRGRVVGKEKLGGRWEWEKNQTKASGTTRSGGCSQPGERAGGGVSPPGQEGEQPGGSIRLDQSTRLIGQAGAAKQSEAGYDL